MWIGQYDVHHELRKLRPLGDNRAVVRYLQGVPIINSKDDWDAFLYRAVIGNCHKLIVSEKCLQSCAPYALGTYAVHRETLQEREMTGEPDVILLGQYKNRPGIFPVHDIMVGDRNWVIVMLAKSQLSKILCRHRIYKFAFSCKSKRTRLAFSCKTC